MHHSHTRRAALPARVLALMALTVLLVPAGPAVAPAHATAPDDGLCLLTSARDEELVEELDDDEDDFLPPLFAEEGVAIVAGRPAALLIQTLDIDEASCAEFADELAEDLGPFGAPFAVQFFPGALPGGSSDPVGVVVLTLSSGGTGGGDPVGWADLGGLEGAFGLDLTGDITISSADPSEATVALGTGGSGVPPLGAFLAIDLPEGAYVIDIEPRIWAGDDDLMGPPTRVLSVPLDLDVAPPLGMCVSTLLLDADAYEATLAELEAIGIALGDEENELDAEFDDLESIPDPERTAEQEARIDEIRDRRMEIEDERRALDAAFSAAPFTALVSELEPGMRLYLTIASLPLFASACTTFFGPDAVLIPGTVEAGGPGGLSSIEHLAVRAVLERGGAEVAWDTVGGGFAYSDIVEALVDGASVDFPGRTVEPELDTTGAALTTGLVPAIGPFGAGFLVEVELVAADDLVAGAYTVRGDYLDEDDPSDVRTIGTTMLTFTVAADDPVVTGGGDAAAAEVAGTLECSAPVVGAGGSCLLTAPPGRTFTWEASTNPVFATGQVTTDASGVGAFSFAVPASLLGQQIVVRVIGVAGSAAPVGVAAPPVPSGVPAGSGHWSAWSSPGGASLVGPVGGLLLGAWLLVAVRSKGSRRTHRRTPGGVRT